MSRKILRVPFALKSLAYLFNRKKYPLFRLRRSQNGLLQSLRLEKELLLTKTISFNGASFTGLSLPHYPSKAFDRAVALGALNSCAVGTPLKRSIDNVIVAITGNCTYGCRHCYELRNINRSNNIPVDLWKRTVSALQDLGVGIIILSGGEPMQRFEDVVELLRTADRDRSDFHLHTTGFGVTEERARKLRNAGLTCAAVGFDDVDPRRLNAFRGNDRAFDTAVNALKCFNRAGIFTYTNMCVTREFVRSGDFWRYFDLVKELNVGLVQILEPRPCGGYDGMPMTELFDDEDRQILFEIVRQGNTERKYRKYPLLYYLAFIERSEHIGCTMGGLTHFAIDSAGSVNPCVFVPVSFGNIKNEDLPVIVRRMRAAVPHPIHAECPSILLSPVLRRTDHEQLQRTTRFDEIRHAWTFEGRTEKEEK